MQLQHPSFQQLEHPSFQQLQRSTFLRHEQAETEWRSATSVAGAGESAMALLMPADTSQIARIPRSLTSLEWLISWCGARRG
jgi:hypothetical protein